MRNKPNYHQKGSVIVMVVGLLVMLAMIGTTFIIISHMDRKESRSVSIAASMKPVADGYLQQIRVKLAEDLYINTSDVIYGSATDYKQQVDYPHEDYDKHLASFAPVDTNGDGTADTWKHLTNHNSGSGFADVASNDLSLVDTDGYFNDGTNAGDAVLFSSGVTSRSGDEYYVAYRLIDASGLMNANTAWSPSSAASGTVMPVTNIALDAITNATTRDDVHAARNGSTTDNITAYNANYVRRPLNPSVSTYRPFEMSDMLALAWGGTVPNTASGRLWEALGGENAGTYFPAAGRYLTIHSASRDYIRQTTGVLDTAHRVNLNDAGFDDLFKAFYNAIPEGIAGFTGTDAARRLVAAQLAANVIDYRDGDDTPYQPSAGDMTNAGLTGTTIFGVERQPFITEAWLRLEWVGGAGGSLQQWSAIELYNPYKTAVSLAGYKLKVGSGTANPLQNNPGSIPAGGRVVIVSNAAEIQAVAKSQDANLKLKEICTLYRDASGGGPVPVGSVGGIGEFGLAEPSAAAPEAVHARIRRDDAASRAKYSVAVYDTAENYTYRIGDATCPAADATNLGRSNSDVALGAAVAPTPVFVRNSKLINLGELSRIFYVGPTSSDVPLDEVLQTMSPTNVSNGRLYSLGTTAGTAPQLPPACMLGDYVDVLTPSTSNGDRTDTIYGRVNINTAPWQVIRYLPGISAMAQRDLIAKDIVAYRDLLDNSGGTNYSSDRAAVGVAGLRNDAGFASSGEVAIPLAKIVTPRPNNTYNTSAPNCYKIAGGSDDGLDSITDDLSKYDIYHSWLSNQVTVRSDVYIAYIRVQIGSSPDTAGAVRRYVAVIDRSNCTSATDLPKVLMFAEMK